MWVCAECRASWSITPRLEFLLFPSYGIDILEYVWSWFYNLFRTMFSSYLRMSLKLTWKLYEGESEEHKSWQLKVDGTGLRSCPIANSWCYWKDREYKQVIWVYLTVNLEYMSVLILYYLLFINLYWLMFYVCHMLGMSKYGLNLEL
jgi:hypothetical protein